jgi:acetyl esterase/lipase
MPPKAALARAMLRRSYSSAPATWCAVWKVTKGGPPAILFFGTEDDLLAGGRVFARRMMEAGNRVELYTAAGQRHGFSQDGGGAPWHALVVRQTDLFLSSLRLLKGKPTMKLPAGPAALTKERL